MVVFVLTQHGYLSIGTDGLRQSPCPLQQVSASRVKEMVTGKRLFFRLAFGLKSGYKQYMLERAQSNLSSVFCAHPCRDYQVFVAWSRMLA